MQNYDIVTIEGRATQDPALKKTKTGKSVCGFSLAVNHYSKDDSEPKVSFIDVEAWDKLAEICAGNVSKGRRLMVVGSLRQDRWENAEGKKQSRIKIVGKEVRFLETLKKPEGEKERKSA
ncbi:MAG TPA: single-stranded DNA-binding protein [Spirochaetota bacterium]|nr:single-stranded DNA-binding protein [Spirochaetota bacterium]HOD14341.1 single-stranded DNA-binding protein [Spirochaetota bacterium]HPG50781.1 single-stranded DNA-binding protein [Spirochaetota bacterium]HPN12433.1 single-stranded DNA-binding protein [Spirochaetota bacterium]HQL83998.1 single-stranded DNA-binding protein [Spirochaetota bacterium]